MTSHSDPTTSTVEPLTRLSDVQSILRSTAQPQLAELVKRLRDDLIHKRVHVVVSGEFKRGKSSLINALLGDGCQLPVDVLPTTAVVHLLRYSATPGMTVHRADGSEEKQPHMADGLRAFAAEESGGSVKAAEIEYLELALPAPLLQEGLILVDTPGINDVVQSRSAVVERMIPLADAVIFVQDAGVQLSGSEKQFLSERLLKGLTPPILFVLNKLDQIEDIERDNVIMDTERSLQELLGDQQHQLVATSTIDPAIGVEPVRQFLQSFMAGGERHRAATLKRRRALEFISAQASNEFSSRAKLASAEASQLKKLEVSVREQSRSYRIRFESFERYMDDNGPALLIPAMKASLGNMLNDLQKQISVEISMHHDPALLAANVLPLRIENTIKAWFVKETGNVKLFYDKYQAAMIAEMLRNFGSEQSVLELRKASPDLLQRLEVKGIESHFLLGGNNDTDMARMAMPAAGALIGALFFSGIGTPAVIIGSLVGGMFMHERKSSQLLQHRNQLQAQVQAHFKTLKGNIGDLLTERCQEMFNTFKSAMKAHMNKILDARETRIQEAVNLSEGNQQVKAALEDNATKFDRLVAELRAMPEFSA